MRPPAIGAASPAGIGPAGESDHTVVFPVPAGARPVRLRVSVLLGWHIPTAQWIVGG